ncbi:protocatechuate 3,4-dioxygenase subunit alpha [Rathayibacter sp. VKM Ac-2805]|uniref:protocatechuate 3,4-dioxygenase subunit alpha n=1 Tax=Rathayibacter sp. VKM Ac-2805 TaxID=2609258 RepID=UPI00131FC88A|nr:protocatechuate 3,4-dioxygenase subunit alpha [Rathayibacter sp. VKM Ac-2805]QHC75026.1 protocatechuate 3,4-dioxygenase subunit alpha [Rathayibacter sp. VKM Ac-2805]
MPELAPTPSQTVGPFFGYALPYDGGPELVAATHPGAIRLRGTITDGAGEPVPDAVVEIWQRDAEGRIPRERGSLLRDGIAFTGFGRTATTRAGEYAFTTLRPGAAEGGASFVVVTVFARGVTHHLGTRAYFAGEDALLRALEPARRRTLLVVEEGAATGLPVVRFDIRLQGEGETVFLDLSGGLDG